MWSVTFSDLPSPRRSVKRNDQPLQGFAQAGNRYHPRIKSEDKLFRIML
jgi:hypothetical protein